MNLVVFVLIEENRYNLFNHILHEAPQTGWEAVGKYFWHPKGFRATVCDDQPKDAYLTHADLNVTPATV